MRIETLAEYARYLQQKPPEVAELYKDLLISITSFFRDPKVFDFLTETTIPDLIRHHPPDKPLRVWVAGCSTGEETYSLAMLFSDPPHSYTQISATLGIRMGSIGPQRARCLERLRRSDILLALGAGEFEINTPGGGPGA